MNKKRMTELMLRANKAIESAGILKDNCINESYNGLTAAFGVTVAMNGLLPALVIYYQQTGESRKTDRRKILEAIGCMIGKDNDSAQITDAKSLLNAAIENANDKNLKRKVLDCAVALKQIIRTYTLKTDEPQSDKHEESEQSVL